MNRPSTTTRKMVDKVEPPNASETLAAKPDNAPLWKRYDVVWIPILTLFGFLLFFEMVYRSGLVSELVLPSPFDVIDEMWALLFSSFFWTNLWVTLQEALMGFGLGILVGGSLGVAISMSKVASKALYPFIVLVQAMPRVALAPVFITILGFGMSAKVLTALVICFFPIFINTLIGLQNVDRDAMDLMRSLRATRVQIFRRLQLPSALPVIFAGLKTGMTLALTGAIVGELSAANAGIALLIETAAYQLRMDAVFASILWLAIVAVILFGVMEYLDRKLVFWANRGEELGHN